MPPTMRVKSEAEIFQKLRDLVHKHRKKWFKRHLQPMPENCGGATLNPDGSVERCTFCQAAPGEPCARQTAFIPRYPKDTLHEQFRKDINSPQKLVRDYRDVAILLWVLGRLDGDTPVESKVVDGSLMDAAHLPLPPEPPVGELHLPLPPDTSPLISFLETTLQALHDHDRTKASRSHGAPEA